MSVSTEPSGALLDPLILQTILFMYDNRLASEWIVEGRRVPWECSAAYHLVYAASMIIEAAPKEHRDGLREESIRIFGLLKESGFDMEETIQAAILARSEAKGNA